jgi:hypothetical protein
MAIVWSWDGHIENGVPRYQVRSISFLVTACVCRMSLAVDLWPNASERWLSSCVAMDAVGQAVRT